MYEMGDAMVDNLKSTLGRLELEDIKENHLDSVASLIGLTRGPNETDDELRVRAREFYIRKI